MVGANQKGPAGESSAVMRGNQASRPLGPDPLIGRIINGRYRIDAVIARGGMGKVYRAEQAPLRRVCALKILSPRYDGEDDPEFHRRFFLEASTAAKLTHANTVTIFDYGKADNDEIYYIAMEYIEGRTLSSVLQEGPLPEERVRNIAAQICRSLREAHGLGVVHRDLKPGNIMLTDKGDERDSVKVLDFGLVKDVTNDAENHTQEGIFMGSPKYMAPEQILGLALTARADVYSLGIMLFEMLTGRVPYDRGGANIATLMAHVNEPIPNMRSMAPNAVISPQMEAIVYRCLEKDPARRYASMSSLLLAIKGMAEDGSIDTSGPFPAPRFALGPHEPYPQDASMLHASERPPHAAPASMPIPMQAPAAVPMAPAPMPVPRENPMPGIGRTPGALQEATVLVRRPQGNSKRRVLLAIATGVGIALALSAGAILAMNHFGAGKMAEPLASATAGGQAAKSAEPAAATQAPSAAPLAQRVIHVESEPPGAAVTEDNEELCAGTPCDVTLAGESAAKEHHFTLTKKGFRPSKPLAVDLQASKVSGALVPAESAPAPVRKKSSESPKADSSSSKPDPYKPDPYQ